MASGKTLKYMWPQNRKSDESYLMRFDIDGVEVLRRRQKRSRPCSDFWAEHDNEIKTKHSDDIGCRLQYKNKTKNTTFCKHKAQMKKLFHLRFDDYGVLPPCQTMEKINYLYSERTLDIKKDSWARRGYFWLGISIAQDHFKEIVQNSEITSLERVAVDNKFRYVGKLATPSSSNPANMLVRFQLSKYIYLPCFLFSIF